ncbi:hypothetical protein COCON_G00178930 [Conger conger]|uniref:G protein-coupled receptor 157 n=2 Tax=Conger conger TaxID=82655 RepID=A0A9Q1HT31_CONCO|nr:hypothetical protein COCON_G00178930 [Conger conger]
MKERGGGGETERAQSLGHAPTCTDLSGAHSALLHQASSSSFGGPTGCLCLFTHLQAQESTVAKRTGSTGTCHREGLCEDVSDCSCVLFKMTWLEQHRRSVTAVHRAEFTASGRRVERTEGEFPWLAAAVYISASCPENKVSEGSFSPARTPDYRFFHRDLCLPPPCVSLLAIDWGPATVPLAKALAGKMLFQPFESVLAGCCEERERSNQQVYCRRNSSPCDNPAHWTPNPFLLRPPTPNLRALAELDEWQRLADRLVLWFHIISWGVPLLITVVAVSEHKIGYDASEVSVGWCWVSIDASYHVLWMLLTGKIWEFAAYVTLPVLYILIKRHIHGAHAALSEYRPILASSIQAQSRSSMADRKMTFIPIIFISLRIWSSLRFLLMLVDSPALQHPLLVTLHGIGNTFQGAANCIMFVLCTKPVRSRLLNTVCCCSCAENSSTDMSVQEPPSEDAPVRHENTVPRRWGEDC